MALKSVKEIQLHYKKNANQNYGKAPHLPESLSFTKIKEKCSWSLRGFISYGQMCLRFILLYGMQDILLLYFISTRWRPLFFFSHHYIQLLLSLKDSGLLELERSIPFFLNYSLKDYMCNWHSLFLERLVGFLSPLGKILKYNSSFLFELWKF